MKIYTKTGDDGTTGLFSGKRVKKFDLRVETYGTVDELNSIIGLAKSFSPPEKLKSVLNEISNKLFVLGTDLATPLNPDTKWEVSRIEDKDYSFLEALIDVYASKMPELKDFILPGGTHCAAYLHQARTVCRRAERLAVKLASEDKVNKTALIFLNRLSDFLFTAARYANHLEGVSDDKWTK